jgi:hypothetical protein
MRFPQIWLSKSAGLKFRHFKRLSLAQPLRAKKIPNKERPSEAERPKSREETPKLGSESGEACHRTRSHHDEPVRGASQSKRVLH